MKIPEVKWSIFDFFQLDLKNIPDNSFVSEESKGRKYFRKTLDYKECGIFDIVEIKIIGTLSKTITLKSFHPDSVNMEDLEKFINDLHLVYGPDDETKKRKFTIKDIQEYQNKESDFSFSRCWIKKLFVIYIKRDENEISIQITDEENIKP